MLHGQGVADFPHAVLIPLNANLFCGIADWMLVWGASCDAESERLLAQMNDFFSIVEQMRSVDTQSLEPLAHPVVTLSDMALRLREDVVSETVDRAANQRSAPAVEEGLFLVPKVIE